jgi:hypothetical protein
MVKIESKRFIEISLKNKRTRLELRPGTAHEKAALSRCKFRENGRMDRGAVLMPQRGASGV